MPATIKIDGTRAQTVRTVLMAAFVALAFILAASLGLQKWKRHGFHLDLPHQLGADISQTANGFTYSQSQRGHTLFTIHASSIVQHKSDEAELHDVAITLYGPEGSHREDRIAGSDFLYRKSTGLVIAKGPVEIEMASPTQPNAPSASQAKPDTIHVQTSDLQFDQNTGEAHTAQPLAFTLPRAGGKAVGGDYNSKTGVLVLQSAVELASTENGSTSTVRAAHAELLRDTHLAYLLHAESEYEGGHNSAEEATLHFRPDGSIEHLDAKGHVQMIMADGARLDCATATADFDGHGQPMGAHAAGGMNFFSDTPQSNMHGNAVEGTIQFTPGADGKSLLHHAHFQNAVSFVLVEKRFGGDLRATSTRELTASRLDTDFVAGPGGRSLANSVLAQGEATVNFHDLPYGAPPKHTAIHGQVLLAEIADGHQIRKLHGSGGTSVVVYAPDGATDTSNGDTLDATFLTPGQARNKASGAAGESAAVDTAVQQGHVTMVAAPALDAKTSDGSPQQPLYAEASMSTFHSADQVLHLTGDPAHPPRVHNGTVTITAALIDYRRGSGDAAAEGDVRASYMQGPPPSGSAGSSGAPGFGGTGPVHVVSASAQMTRSTNNTVFLGNAQAPARMWQGPNAVTAPVLELSRQQSSLHAHAAASAQHGAVHATLAGHAGISRVVADTLFYSDTTRTGDFRGMVTARQPNGTVHAEDAQFFLAELSPGEPSQLDRMVAAGHVLLQQPGRSGTGEKLVYTAADGNYLMTGTPAVPPRATDVQKGATTGAALLFRGADDSVEVLANDAQGSSRRTVTDTRTPK